MTLTVELQPDQQPTRWDDHVAVYEAAFEPLSNAFARRALAMLDLRADETLIDVAAGSGGAALLAAECGADVLAIDAASAMVARTRARAARTPHAGHIRAEAMNGMALELPDEHFDAALSVFGVILFPDAERGMREIARVLRPGGRAAIVTWTEPERYELAARVIAAVAAVNGPQGPPVSLPAQLRYRDPADFRALFDASGLKVTAIERVEQHLHAPSARWIAENIAFAPGMAAMVAGLGASRNAVLRRFVSDLEAAQGYGPVALSAVAQVGIAVKPGHDAGRPPAAPHKI